MRKKTFSFLLDNGFWYLIYLIPVICLVFYLFNNNAIEISFSVFLGNIGLDFASSNIVVSTLSDIFGVNGILPLFDNEIIFIITGWFVSTFIIHLAVDFLLFIPRLFHNFLSKTSKEG